MIFERYGPPPIRSDNGREFIATGLLDWLRDQGVTPIQVQKVSPQQDGYIERFNGAMRDELLNREVFHSVSEARVVVPDWVWHYNHERPHSGLEMRTPAGDEAYIAELPTTSSVAASERGE